MPLPVHESMTINLWSGCCHLVVQCLISTEILFHFKPEGYSVVLLYHTSFCYFSAVSFKHFVNCLHVLGFPPRVLAFSQIRQHRAVWFQLDDSIIFSTIYCLNRCPHKTLFVLIWLLSQFVVRLKASTIQVPLNTTLWIFYKDFSLQGATHVFVHLLRLDYYGNFMHLILGP